MAEIKINNNEDKQPEQPSEQRPPAEEKQQQGRASETTGPAPAPAAEAAPPEALTPEKIAELMEKAAERDDFHDKFLRAKAEMINYQKRIQRDKENMADFAVIEIARGWIPVFDDLDRALNAAKDDRHAKHFIKGIKLIEAQLYKVLEDKGIKAMRTAGQVFDPGMHEAVAIDTKSDKPDNTIVDEITRGYVYKDKVVRPAKVRVAKKS
jgi:molecular chaperone GrpE